jgi:asparagine synthase (glutamine-hydrolysing)
MPIFEKRRMQHGAAAPAAFSALFPASEQAYRRAFLDLYAQ